MRQFSLAVAVALVVMVSGCGSSDSTPAYEGFTQPANTIVVNFKVDDSINRVWQAGELGWKGQMQYDPATRLMHFNSDWLAQDPNWATLYDDGPWDTKNTTTNLPGHEPLGAVAGDHIWGVAGFFAKPAADVTIGYGLGDPDAVDRGATWYWIGSAPTVVIHPADTVVNATGLTFPAFGTKDLKIVLDSALLPANTPAWSTSTVEVKGSKWGWATKVAYDDGTHGDDTAADGKYTFVLSTVIDGTVPPYPGLLASGDVAEFVYQLAGAEYKDGAKVCISTGVTAYVKTGAAGTWTVAPITLATANEFGQNTQVVVPSP